MEEENNLNKSEESNKPKESFFEDERVKPTHVEHKHEPEIKKEHPKEKEIKTYSDKEDKEVFELRIKKVKEYLNKKPNFIIYAILAIIVGISSFIRTRNIDKLKDITTGDWTLGPDLDPFLFLRWAEYIVEHGKIFVLDPLRYIPLMDICSGVACNPISTLKEAKLLSYLIAWFFHLISLIPNSLLSLLPGNPAEITVTYAAILFPVVMFALTIIAVFLLTRKIFYSSFENKLYPNIAGLISALFMAVIPIILPRTIAGIPEKESIGFLLILFSFYFLISAFNSKKYKVIVINSILAGLVTAALGLIWGGIIFVLTPIGLSVFLLFLLGKMDKKRLLSYSIWLAVLVPLMMYFSIRYPLRFFLITPGNIPIFVALLLSSFNLFIYPKIKNINLIKRLKNKYNIPREFISLIIVGILFLILLIVFLGPGAISNIIKQLRGQLISPLTSSRFIQTVAENREPFFSEWKNNFGPVINNIPMFFWLFIIGSVVLFKNLIKKLYKKDKTILTISYIILIFGVIFTRFSPSHTFNGTNTISLLTFFGSAVLFALMGIYILYKYNKEDKRELLPKNFGIILLLVFFYVSILGARSGVRFTMVLVPSISIITSYLIVYSISKSIELRNKENMMKVMAMLFALVIVLASIFSAYTFYETSKAQASVFHPSGYNFQWQKAMQWVRDNTPQNAVFSHWWDYGYWIQSIGKRATVLDGGNSIVYWDHLLGRHVLTTPDDRKALEFLYTHKATHLLIDSTDLGKYSAFSSIGGDENNDRLSFFPLLSLDVGATQETRNGFTYVYRGGSNLDEDVIYELNGSEERLLRGDTILAGMFIDENSEGKLLQPRAIFIRQNQQIQIPIRYLYFNNELIDFESGIEAGFFLIETLNPVSTGLERNDKGVGYYLSGRTVNSLLVRKYLFGEEGNFKLVHTQPNVFTEDIRNQGFPVADFSFFQGSFLGPIKIWEIEYPSDIESNPDYLLTDYPDKRLV